MMDVVGERQPASDIVLNAAARLRSSAPTTPLSLRTRMCACPAYFIKYASDLACVDCQVSHSAQLKSARNGLNLLLKSRDPLDGDRYECRQQRCVKRGRPSTLCASASRTSAENLPLLGLLLSPLPETFCLI